MSLGGDFSSSQTSKLRDQAIESGIPKLQKASYSDQCCPTISGYQRSASYPSMVITKYDCPPLTPAQLALFPKVAVPSSVRTQSLIDGKYCASLPDSNKRFANYIRYQIPVPCPPLTPLAASAGISRPSVRECNIYPTT